MKSIYLVALLTCLFLSSTSFNHPNKSNFVEQLRICEAAKKIIKAFEEAEIEKLLDGKVIMGEEAQWTSKVTMKGFKDHFVYYDGPWSYFEATLDKKINSLDIMKRELYYIASTLQTCLAISMKYTSEGDEITYEYLTDDMSLLIRGKHINSNQRTISIEIGYE